MHEDDAYYQYYMAQRRRALEHRNGDCRGQWEVSVAPDTRYGAEPGAVVSVLLLCRVCGITHEITAETDAQLEWREDARYRRTSIGRNDEPGVPEPAPEHRPRLDVHAGNLAHRIESVPPIRTMGLLVVPVERLLNDEEPCKWEVFDGDQRIIGVIYQTRGRRGRVIWHYRRFGHEPTDTPYSSVRAAVRALARDAT